MTGKNNPTKPTARATTKHKKNQLITPNQPLQAQTSDSPPLVTFR